MKSLQMKFVSSSKNGFPYVLRSRYLVLGVELLGIINGHFGHFQIADYETAALDGGDDFADMSVRIRLNHAKGSRRLERHYLPLCTSNFERVKTSA